MAKHAKRFSPSAAERWMTCPGSVTACLDLPNESSSYADEGTAAHYMAEQLAKKPLPIPRVDTAIPALLEYLKENRPKYPEAEPLPIRDNAKLKVT